MICLNSISVHYPVFHTLSQINLISSFQTPLLLKKMIIGEIFWAQKNNIEKMVQKFFVKDVLLKSRILTE